jgi:hypothetical protein
VSRTSGPTLMTPAGFRADESLTQKPAAKSQFLGKAQMSAIGKNAVIQDRSRGA